MNLVGEDDSAGWIKTEFVFGVDKDQTAFGGDGATLREQRQRQFGDVLPLRSRQQSAADDLVRRDRLVMVSVGCLGCRRDDRRGQFLVLSQPIGETNAIDFPPPGL